MYCVIIQALFDRVEGVFPKKYGCTELQYWNQRRDIIDRHPPPLLHRRLFIPSLSDTGRRGTSLILHTRSFAGPLWILASRLLQLILIRPNMSMSNPHTSRESSKNHGSMDWISLQEVSVISFSSTHPAQGTSVFAKAMKKDDKAPIKKSIMRERSQDWDCSPLRSSSPHSRSWGGDCSTHNRSPTRSHIHPQPSLPHHLFRSCSTRRDHSPCSRSHSSDRSCSGTLVQSHIQSRLPSPHYSTRSHSRWQYRDQDKIPSHSKRSPHSKRTLHLQEGLGP